MLSYNDYVMTNEKGYRVFCFDNIYELANLTEHHISKGRLRTLMSERGTYENTKTHNLEEAIKLLKYGWEYGVEELNKQIKLENINGTKLKQEYSVIGGNASVPRYLQGIPTNMINHKRVEVPHKVLNVYKDISYNASFTVEEIIKQSVKAIQIIQQLEKQNYRINLFVVDNGFNDKEEIFVKLKIKNSNEKLNLKKMAFPLTHPSMLRRINFKLLENVSWLTPSKWEMNYGYPFSHDKKRFENYIFSKDIFIPNEVGNIDSFVKTLNK